MFQARSAVQAHPAVLNYRHPQRGRRGGVPASSRANVLSHLNPDPPTGGGASRQAAANVAAHPSERFRKHDGPSSDRRTIKMATRKKGADPRK